MQRTKLVRGALERGLEIPPIDAAVNKILDNNPGMRLVQVTVVNVKYTSCLFWYPELLLPTPDGMMQIIIRD